MDALDAGADVMVFSDNVPVDQEVALKRAAAERGLLVMGPDCGTAVVGGLGLGFANAVRPARSASSPRPAPAASSCSRCSTTPASASPRRSASAAATCPPRSAGSPPARRCAGSTTTTSVELIVVVSKPPAPDVAAEIEEYAASLATPVEFALLGPGQPDLTAATEAVLRRLGRDVPTWPVRGRRRPPRRAGRPSLRGLFVGGTLCTEARIVAEALVGADAGHTFVDFGDDDYTAGRAHPMIDPTLRLEHLARAAADPAPA